MEEEDEMVAVGVIEWEEVVEIGVIAMTEEVAIVDLAVTAEVAMMTGRNQDDHPNVRRDQEVTLEEVVEGNKLIMIGGEIPYLVDLEEEVLLTEEVEEGLEAEEVEEGLEAEEVEAGFPAV